MLGQVDDKVELGQGLLVNGVHAVVNQFAAQEHGQRQHPQVMVFILVDRVEPL